MLALVLASIITGFAPSSADEARRGEMLLEDGRDYEALKLFVEIARAHPDDVRAAGWWIDAARAARWVAERRQVANALEQAVAAAARARAVDLETREPFVRKLVGTMLEESAGGCSAFHDTVSNDRYMAAYIELFPDSPYVGDVLVARAQRGVWRGLFDDEVARALFIAAAKHDFPGAGTARACAADMRLPTCGARADAGRLIERAQAPALRPLPVADPVEVR